MVVHEAQGGEESNLGVIDADSDSSSNLNSVGGSGSGSEWVASLI